MGLLNTSGEFGVPAGSFQKLDKGTSASQLSNPNSPQVDPVNPLYQLLTEPATGDTLSFLSSQLNLNFSLSKKNAIMNGSFQIWQRGTTFSAMSNNAVFADRWRYHKLVTGSVHTAIRSQDIPGLDTTKTGQRTGTGNIYSTRLELTTGDSSVGASDIVYFKHRIENPDTFFKFSKQNLVLSFWVKATKTGTYSVFLGDTTAFGDASGQGLSYITSYTINETDTWEYKVVYIPANTTSTPAASPISLGFVLMSGTSYHTSNENTWANQSAKYAVSSQENGCNDTTTCKYFYITGVQLEIGTVETPFDHIDFTTELLSCMRFYEKSFAYATTPAQAVSWTTGRPAIAPQCVAASTVQYPTVYSIFRVPKQQAATSSNTVSYNPVAANSSIRNVTAAADCGSTTLQSNSTDMLAWSSSTPAGSNAGELLALHWATDVELT